MIGIGCIIKCILMATCTLVGRIVVIALVALIAVFPYRHMGPIQDKKLVVYVKPGRCPAGCRGVA